MGNLKSKTAYFVHKRKTRKLQKCRTEEEDDQIATNVLQLFPQNPQWSQQKRVKKLELSPQEREENHLVNINIFFPKETWEKVLTKLTGKSDIENCTNASPFFRSLILSKREVDVVLPKVFGILANRYNDDKNNDESFKETNSGSIPWSRPNNKIPHRMSGFWKLRLVCKTWNTIIEDLHQNEDAGHFDMGRNLNKANNSVLGRKWGTERFHSGYRVQKFIQHFGLTHLDSINGKPKKCPFVGRSVVMDIGFYVKNIRVYLKKMYNLLEKCGKDIWYFQIFYHDRAIFAVGFVELYTHIKKLVQLMPNLKALEIGFYFKYHDRFLSQEDIDDLREEIEINPFPKLTNLQALSTHSMPAHFFNHVTSQNRQIHQLRIASQDFERYGKIFSETLHNLTQLSLAICSLEDFERFESSELKLKLSNFQFIYYDHEMTYCEVCESDYECYESAPFVSWARVFSALENKLDSSTCTTIYLQLPTPYTDAEKLSVLQDSLTYRFKMSNIQRIAISQTAAFSLDFLLPLKKSVREVALFVDFAEFWKDNSELRVDHIRETEIIHFVGVEEYMQNSNISVILPRLKTLFHIDCRENFRYDFELGRVKRNKMIFS